MACNIMNYLCTCADNGNRGKVGTEASLEQWITSLPLITVGESKFNVKFDWEVEKLGVPGAIIVKNNHASEFFLKTITLDDVPGHGDVVFVANSWVYPQRNYRYNRVFFANDVSLIRSSFTNRLTGINTVASSLTSYVQYLPADLPAQQDAGAAEALP
jgi:linoleate 9S-lipoxygenase